MTTRPPRRTKRRRPDPPLRVRNLLARRMPADRYAVGIDLCGSKLRCRALAEQGQLVARVETQTEAWKGTASVLANLKRMISELLDSTDRSRVTGIGIAAAGQIHPKTHAVVYAPNLSWKI